MHVLGISVTVREKLSRVQVYFKVVTDAAGFVRVFRARAPENA
jgi:hypothetical protein